MHSSQQLNELIFFLCSHSQCTASGSKKIEPSTEDIDDTESDFGNAKATEAAAAATISFTAQTAKASAESTSNVVAQMSEAASAAALASKPTPTGPPPPIPTAAMSKSVAVPTAAAAAAPTGIMPPTQASTTANQESGATKVARTATTAAYSERKESLTPAADGSPWKRDIDAGAVAASPNAEHQMNTTTVVLNVADSPKHTSIGLEVAGGASNRYSFLCCYFANEF